MKVAIGVLGLIVLGTGLIVWLLSPGAEGAQLVHAQATAPRPLRVAQAYGQVPLSFEPNQGQVDAPAQFVSRGRGYILFLTGKETVLTMAQPQAWQEGTNAGRGSTALRMKLAGANPAPRASGLDLLPGKSHYFIGKDPEKWRTNIPHFARVRYHEVYPGVDLEFYGNDQQLEYDFIIAPGADPKTILLVLKGARRLRVGEEGDLLVELGEGEVRFLKPHVYQGSDGQREEIEGRFLLRRKGEVGFDVGDYDSTRPLVVDPVLVYSTYLGGAGTEVQGAIAADTFGNTYVVGSTTSTDFPTVNPIQASNGGGFDVVITKLNPAGDALVYSSYLGGSDRDTGAGIAVDAVGNVYVTGNTNSTNFPTVSAFQPTYGGEGSGFGAHFGDAFVAKLSADGSALAYSTYLGGSDDDEGYDIAVGAAGTVFVVGRTKSTDFPTANALKATKSGSTDAFVTKVSAEGSALVYSTYLGGDLGEMFGGGGIAVDATGNAYVVGSTQSSNFPTVNAFQSAFGGADDTFWGDGFVTKVSAEGSALLYSTYLGGNGADYAQSIAVDAAGNAYVAGRTESSNFPVANAFRGAHAGGDTDAFVTKLNAAGSALVYSTYLGGNNTETASDIATGSGGEALVIGYTHSSDFPTADPIQSSNAGGADVFIARLKTDGSALAYSTYLGGSGDDFGYGVAVDTIGNAHVTGRTASTDFPTAHPLQAANGGDTDIFVAKLLGGQKERRAQVISE